MRGWLALSVTKRHKSATGLLILLLTYATYTYIVSLDERKNIETLTPKLYQPYGVTSLQTRLVPRKHHS